MSRIEKRIAGLSNEKLIDWICLSCADVRHTHSDDDAQDFINDIREALELRMCSTSEAPDGWKLVPIDPTEEMIEAHIDEQILSGDETGISLENPSDCYRAMINAAPRVPK